MEPDDYLDERSQKSVSELARELGDRLKKEIGLEVEDSLGQFLEAIEESPLGILSETGARQNRIFKLLNDRLTGDEAEREILGQEMDRLIETVKTALEERTEAAAVAEQAPKEKAESEEPPSEIEARPTQQSDEPNSRILTLQDDLDEALRLAEKRLEEKAEAEERAEQALREKAEHERRIQDLTAAKSEAEQTLARLESQAKESDELKASIRTFESKLDEAVRLAEKRLEEKSEADKRLEAAEKRADEALLRAAVAEEKLHEAGKINEKTETKGRYNAIFKFVSVILLILALAAAGYAIFTNRISPKPTSDIQGRVKELKTRFEERGRLIGILSRGQNSLTAKVENLNKEVVSIRDRVARQIIGQESTGRPRAEDRTGGLAEWIGRLDQAVNELKQNQAPIKKDLDALKKEVANLGSARSRAGEHPEMAAIKQKVASLELKINRLAAEPISRPVPKTVTYRISAELYFQSGQSDISEQGAAKVRLAALKIRAKPWALVRVEGHTDDKPLRWTSVGKYIDNMGLSQARAAAVARLLVESGLDPKMISIVGLGPTQPLVPNDSPENRAQNRRVEIKVTDNRG